MQQPRLKIFLVEDNPEDVKLTRYALKKQNIANELFLAKDGEEAEEFLKNTSNNKSNIPDIIILDLNLPKKDGFEVLKIIKSHPHLKAVPVIILSTSTKTGDVRKSYGGYANCYIRKPSDLNDFLDVMTCIKEFWIRTALLPTLKAS